MDTVWAIAASPYVKHYTIGYTSRAGWERLKEHRTWGYQHLVILADKLNRNSPTNLEITLQRRIRADRRHPNYRKSEPDLRD